MAGLVSASFKQGKNMKVLILAETVVDNKRVHAGDVIEVTQSDAHILIGCNKASAHVAKEKKETNRSVGLDVSETPKPKKRSKAK
tara:strand:+ start:1229 stop:1483 length:255 start_codon:yes stop_codon:yes gene_type:complete